jgi:hypothetical protein
MNTRDIIADVRLDQETQEEWNGVRYIFRIGREGQTPFFLAGIAGVMVRRVL